VLCALRLVENNIFEQHRGIARQGFFFPFARRVERVDQIEQRGAIAYWWISTTVEGFYMEVMI